MKQEDMFSDYNWGSFDFSSLRMPAKKHVAVSNETEPKIDNRLLDSLKEKNTQNDNKTQAEKITREIADPTKKNVTEKKVEGDFIEHRIIKLWLSWTKLRYPNIE